MPWQASTILSDAAVGAASPGLISLRRDNAVFRTRQAAALASVPEPDRVTAIAADAADLVQVTGSARLRKELMALPRQAAAWRNTPAGRQLRAIVASVA